MGFVRDTPVVLRWVALALVLGLAVAIILAPRIRAQPADWFVSEHLSLAPAVRGLQEPTYVQGAPDDVGGSLL